jgi:hypothetical protein
MAAWWSANLADFLAREPEQIVGGLATRLVEAHTINRDTQVRAWRAQIELLHRALTGSPQSWHLLLEYPLRLGRRIDAVLLTGHAVLVLEFKVGATSFTNIDRQQVEDYALDLFDSTRKAACTRSCRSLWPPMRHPARPTGRCS